MPDSPFAYVPGDSFLSGLQKAIAKQETGPFDKGDGNIYRIRNSVGASGRYQFLDGTWREVFTLAGKPVPSPQAHKATAEQQDRAFCTLMDRYRLKFGDNIELLAVAWHAGYGAATKVQEKKRTPADFKDGKGASTATYAYNVGKFYLEATGADSTPTPSASIASEKLHGSSSGSVAIPTADEAAALLDIVAFGFNNVDLEGAWVGGDVDLTTGMVSEVTLRFHDPGLKVTTGVSTGTSVVWGQWPLSIAAIETGPGPAGTGQVRITARSLLSQQLRKKRPSVMSYPKRSASQVIEQVLGTGAKFMLQPTPVQAQVVINTDEATGLPETWWDAFQRWAQDPTMTGGPDFLCFEAAGVIYFGAPSWLVTRCPVIKVSVGFDADGIVLDDGVDEMPTVRETTDDPDNPVSVSMRVRPELGARIFPGMALELDMARFPGTYLITRSAGELDGVSSWTIEGVLPIDRVSESTDTPTIDSASGGEDGTALPSGGDTGGNPATDAKAPTDAQKSTDTRSRVKIKIPVSGTADISGLKPEFAASLTEFFAAALAAGHNMTVYSAWRSYAHQKRLWEAELKKRGGNAELADDWVAPPGRSNHGRGIAADIHAYGTKLNVRAGGKVGAASKWAHANAGRFGLYFPLSNEDWHIEPKGSRG